MKLPPTPQPAMVMYINSTCEEASCYNETQLIEYGRICAEAMREACAAKCESAITTTTMDLARSIRALEIAE